MAAVAVVTAPFFTAIIIVMWQVVGVSSPGNVVLILVVGDAAACLVACLTPQIVHLTARADIVGAWWCQSAYKDVQPICLIHRCTSCSLPPYVDACVHASLGSLHGSFLICLLVEDSDVALLATWSHGRAPPATGTNFNRVRI